MLNEFKQVFLWQEFNKVISNNFFAAIVISFGIGASSMQLPCVFTLLQSMVPAEAMSSAAGALNGMAVGFGALSPVLIGFILSG